MNLLKILFSLASIISTYACNLSIKGDKLLLNDVYINNGSEAEGLLINSRMIQGISDGFENWPYPDTKSWDANRNTAEFITQMSHWNERGLNGFTIGMQGGAPTKNTSKQTHRNSAYHNNGDLKADYMNRLKMILKESNRLNMIVILSLFYRSQVDIFSSYSDILKATENTIFWIKENNFTNIIIEPVNECEFSEFKKYKLNCNQNIPKLLDLINKYKIPSGNSYKGGGVPSDNIIGNSSIILLHGNSLNSESEYTTQLKSVKNSKAYRGQPIIYNEAGTKLFLDWAVKNKVGWGYYDQGSNNYIDGFQSPPINWSINTSKKKAFFNEIEKYV